LATAASLNQLNNDSWIKGATSKGGEKEMRGSEGNMRKGEVTEGEGRDFGPSQCWKQIDASAINRWHEDRVDSSRCQQDYAL